LLGGGGDLGEAAGLAEGSDETGGLAAGGGEGAVLGYDDGPGEETEDGEQDEDSDGDRAGVVEDLDDGGAMLGDGSWVDDGGIGGVLLEQ